MLDASESILASNDQHDYDKVRNTLVSMVIEKILFNIGNDTYEKVIEKLYKDYHCYLSDCYEHPEYLSEILQKLYGNAHRAIMKSISEDLEEFSDYKPIARFLERIN